MSYKISWQQISRNRLTNNTTLSTPTATIIQLIVSLLPHHRTICTSSFSILVPTQNYGSGYDGTGRGTLYHDRDSTIFSPYHPLALSALGFSSCQTVLFLYLLLTLYACRGKYKQVYLLYFDAGSIQLRFTSLVSTTSTLLCIV